jgi:hypothetical protein
MFSRSIIDDSRSIIDDSRSIIDDSIVMFPLVASFMIDIYDDHVFIAQATGFVLLMQSLSMQGLIPFKKMFFFGLCGFWIWTDPEHRESNITVLCLLGWK